MKLNEKYNSDSFIDFIKDFLPEDLILREEDVVINKDRYKEITKAKILGFCESLDLHVLEMDHTHDKDPRVTIATDAFKILADHWIHKALVIFKNNDSDNYRFSYLTITLDLNDKNKVIKKYSNARRCSFYLGTNAKVRTPEQQLIKKGKIKDVEDLLNRFSVEVVNKQFYLEVAKFFDELVSIEDQNLILPGVSETDINTRKSFAVRLIGRLMFCWFLKQKKSSNGQLIPDEILSSKVIIDNYYHNTLEPLFFSVLNTSIDNRDIRNELFDKVPYLNGGLFNPQDEDYYELNKETFTSKYENALKISDKWFKEFFELLETYNFTIDENTVFDQELSVDPEMLGRIFENLLAEINPETGSSERKRTGSFYTPRQIVEYMVDQSLVEHFKTKTNIEENKLKALVSYDLADDVEFPLDQEDRSKIINAVESLKILDPACGSGAYPIGALQKIVYILQQVDPDCTLWLEKKLKGVPDLYKQKIINEVKQNPFDYTRKLDVIKNSIFGVDIQPIAVDVSRLRCFLTLVVEAEIDDTKSNRGIEPLPNLDFKFVCANTLIPLPKSNNMGLFDDHSGITVLSKIMSEYFSCNSHMKNELKMRFTNAQKEILEKNISAFGKNTGELTLKLAKWNPFSNHSNSWFDPEWMFGLGSKFDVVIGNPPYVSVKSIDSEDKKLFSKLFETGKGRFNLFTLFLEKGHQLLDVDGILSYILPESLYTHSEYKYIRRYLLEKTQIISISNFTKRVFEASVDTSVIVMKNNHNPLSEIKIVLDLNDHIATIKQVEIDDIILTKNSNDTKKILDTINNNKIKLADIIEVQQGIIYSGQKKEDVFSNEKIDETYKKILDGRDIQKYYINYDAKQENRYIKYTKQLHRPREERLFLAEKKLIFPRRSKSFICAIDTTQFYLLNTAYVCLLNNSEYTLEFILGILNSKTINYLYANTYIGWQITIPAINSIPIPKIISEEERALANEIVSLVDQINIIKEDKNNDSNSLELKIDELVMDLYGLTEEEKDVVRNF